VVKLRWVSLSNPRALKCMPPESMHNDATNHVIPHEDAESPTHPGTTKNEIPDWELAYLM